MTKESSAVATPALRAPRRLPLAASAHLVGIGGAGMSSLAALLKQAGWQITGSDLATQQADGLPRGVVLGHAASHVPEAVDFVIHSLAVPSDNIELSAARDRGVPVLSYPEMLGRLMASRTGVAIAGTHGKSTTTAMAAAIFACAGFDPTAIIGAVPIGCNSGGLLGEGKHVLVEACEYRRSFCQLVPKAAVVLGIEADHFDCYDSNGELERGFEDFLAGVGPDGLIIANRDCAATRRVAEGKPARTKWFGIDRDADWQAVALSQKKGRYQFELLHRGQSTLCVQLQTPGRHNVYNALAAAALAAELGVPAPFIAEGLEGFAGLQRRLEVLGSEAGVWLVDDYAHHPTEVSASLSAIREMFPARKIWCVFQPHQALRLRRLLDGLAESLHNADTVVVAEVYRAREGAASEDEPTAADLAQRASEQGATVAAPHDWPSIADMLVAEVRAGDVVATIGAGNIGKLIHELAERFRERAAAG